MVAHDVGIKAMGGEDDIVQSNIVAPMIALLSRTLGSQLLLADDLATDRLHTCSNWSSM